MQVTLAPFLPLFVGKRLNETLGWLSTATEGEVLAFYSNMDNYSISQSPTNHRMLLSVVTQRATQLGMDVIVHPNSYQHYSSEDVEQLGVESPIEPNDDDHYPVPPDDAGDQVPSARFLQAVSVANRLIETYGDGQGSEPEGASLTVALKDITLLDILNLSWVFLHLTTMSEEGSA